MTATAVALPWISEPCLRFWHNHSIAPRVSQCQYNWQIYCAGLGISRFKIYAEDCPVHLNYNQTTENLWLCRNIQAVSQNSNLSTWYHLEHVSGKHDWQICCAGSVKMRPQAYAEVSPVHLKFDHIATNPAFAIILRAGAFVFWHSNSISPCLTLLLNGIGKYAVHDLGLRNSWQIPQNSLVNIKVVELCFFIILTSKCIVWCFQCTTDSQLRHHCQPIATAYTTLN
jgi:hypothetical protein